MGTEPWSARERAERFAEYVAILDGVLRGAGRPYSFAGRRLWVRDVPTAPGPVQQPRPPIIVGGQSPTVLRVAAEWADVWNTHGPIGAGVDDVLNVTADQNRRLDELCVAAGRDAATLRRSFLTLGATDLLWSAPVRLEDIVECLTRVGVTEFVIGWPPDERLGEFENLAREVIPSLRIR